MGRKPLIWYPGAIYHWSSYPMIIGETKEKLVNSNKILSYFNGNHKRKSYKSFVERAIKIRLD